MRFGRFFLMSGMVMGCAASEDGDDLGAVDMSEAFPFDGARTWEFINDNTDVSFKLIGQLSGDVQQSTSGASIYTIDYNVECVAADPDCVDGALLRSISWSSDPVQGVQIHNLMDGQRDIDFDPPLVVAGAEMSREESLSTQTAGFNWTTTLIATEDCPVDILGGIQDSCVHIVLDDGDTGNYNAALVGDYWAVAGYNVVAMDILGDEGRWSLSDHVCEDECDGTW